LQAERLSVLGNLLGLNQADLAATRLSVPAEAAKISRLAKNTFIGDDFDGFDGGQRSAGFDRMQVQRGDAGIGVDGRRRCHGGECEASNDFRQEESASRVRGDAKWSRC